MSASVMQRFSNMKLLLESIDKLVFGELTKKVDRLSRLTARSDAMLAVYPGGKSRFQRIRVKQNPMLSQFRHKEPLRPKTCVLEKTVWTNHPAKVQVCVRKANPS